MSPILFEDVIGMLELSKGKLFKQLEDAVRFITLELNLLNCKKGDHMLIHDIENPYDTCIWCNKKVGYDYECFSGDDLSCWRTYWENDR
ncbi:MAG: hypothetical protein QM652_05380 [Legionella sp.]|uniref:hypothetical protein n=1 Tax=Legionella sp. TaxID=459 RepID=UPI0039E61C1C